jgi:hypothetical protein
MAAFYNKFDAHALPQSRGILAEALCALLAWMAEQPALAAARLMLEASGSARGARGGDTSHDIEIANELELVRYYARRFGFVPAYPDDVASDADDINVPMIATVADIVSHCRAAGAREAKRPRLEGGTRRARRSARRARAQAEGGGRGAVFFGHLAARLLRRTRAREGARPASAEVAQWPNGRRKRTQPPHLLGVHGPR